MSPCSFIEWFNTNYLKTATLFSFLLLWQNWQIKQNKTVVSSEPFNIASFLHDNQSWVGKAPIRYQVLTEGCGCTKQHVVLVILSANLRESKPLKFHNKLHWVGIFPLLQSCLRREKKVGKNIKEIITWWVMIRSKTST